LVTACIAVIIREGDDPVLRGVWVVLDSTAYWIPAFAGYDGLGIIVVRRN